MKVKCSSCHKLYNIPDEKTPAGNRAIFSCPACKNTIELTVQSEHAKDGSSPVPEALQENMQREFEPSSQSTGEKLTGDALKKKILRTVDDLPAMPQIVLKAQEIMSNPNSDFKEFERTLEADQALVAKVLKLANSAYYGRSGKVSSIKRACIILGYNTIGELVTMAGTSDLLDKPLNGYDLEAGDLWRHSMAVAFGSRIIAIRKQPELANDAFIGGLLHDAGKILFNPYVFNQKTAFVEYMNGKKNVIRAERKILGFDHAELASKVCEKWSLPKPICSAIGNHHNLHTFGVDKLAGIICLADEISRWYAEDSESTGLVIDVNIKRALGIQDDEIELIESEMVSSVDQISDEMGGVR